MLANGRRSIAQVVDQLNRELDCRLSCVGVAEVGETAGAAFVTWPDGRQSVVTTATVSAGVMEQTSRALEVARAEGCRVPRHELVAELEDHVVAVVQERLPGRHPSTVDGDLIDTLVVANDRFAKLLADHPDLALPRVALPSAAAACRSGGPLDQHSDRSRALLRRIRVIDPLTLQMPEQDLVHSDLTVSNVLLEHGEVSGVIDWNNGAIRGDCRFALVKLLFDLTWEANAPGGGRHHVAPAALARLEMALHDLVDPARLRSYWAWWTLVMLDWTIRSASSDVVDLHLDLGERGLG